MDITERSYYIRGPWRDEINFCFLYIIPSTCYKTAAFRIYIWIFLHQTTAEIKLSNIPYH